MSELDEFDEPRPSTLPNAGSLLVRTLTQGMQMRRWACR